MKRREQTKVSARVSVNYITLQRTYALRKIPDIPTVRACVHAREH